MWVETYATTIASTYFATIRNGKNGFEPLRPSLRPGRSQLLALSE
uniref:Uncharacterized protein n=1 Tax=Siphoviridae sp. ctVif31 TaxID=2825532 RepID=A0A8S5Q3X6_9CAUD|nr:MAG TPA: hypothetical protein [Siphoviridae sp. ctVif31]DAY83373.1 MAG TPA: hypothetical protein [Caudoviricetes sp.]